MAFPQLLRDVGGGGLVGREETQQIDNVRF